ncbi:hypothetical protein F511_35462 [Dorcoceras hygrometricum]|uniref:Uncharacterized protein n=1 Tax=Dorcoceras hygrometricum TaxID=472368 RepID=A0A2Z7AH36_9LAMI|nr:hypothetical protein F511_35462 [Dorcoceras hygrometricum]
MAGASTCSDQFSLVSQRFEPRLVSLEPSGPGVGPAGSAPPVVAGAGRTIVKTGRCSLAPLDFRAYGSSSNIGVKWHFSGGVTYRDPEVMILWMSIFRLAVRISERLSQQYPVTAFMIQFCHVTVSIFRLAVRISERLSQQYPVTAFMIQFCHVTVDTGF